MRNPVANKVRCSAIALSGVLLVSSALFAADSGSQVSDVAREVESLKAVCAKCHDLEVIMDTPKSYDAWHDTVQAMVDRGATGTDEQFGDIMDYLHHTMTTINVNSADPRELEIVLNVPQTVAQAIVTRRASKRFTDLADLKSVPGIDAPALDLKARLIFFQ
jgi:competence protein ComEA